MAYIKQIHDGDYTILVATGDNLESHPAIIASNRDPNDETLNEAERSLIGKFEIVEGEPENVKANLIFQQPD